MHDRARSALLPHQVYFRPSLLWEVCLDDHVLPAGIEMRVDLAAGKNHARFAPPDGAQLQHAYEGSSRHAAISQQQTRTVSSEQQDAPAVKTKLLAACTWGDPDAARHLIRTCFVSSRIASEALVETAQHGNMCIAAALIDAGADADQSVDQLDSKTALHIACQHAHEALAAYLISRMSQQGIHKRTRTSSCTAFDLLRQSDLGGVARRLEALASGRFGPDWNSPDPR